MQILKFRINKVSPFILAIVERNDPHHPYVVCKISAHSMDHREWHSGDYFQQFKEALDHFYYKSSQGDYYND